MTKSGGYVQTSSCRKGLALEGMSTFDGRSCLKLTE